MTLANAYVSRGRKRPRDPGEQLPLERVVGRALSDETGLPGNR